MDNWNERLFVLINASDHPVALWVAAANLVASDMVFLVVMLFGALWVWGRPRRRPALVASAVATALALVANQVFGLLWYEPRPFVVGAQHENAFPSGHATFMFTAG